MKKILLLVLAVLCTYAVSAQVTSSAIGGRVADAQGEALVGATVIAVHAPSGTQYGVVANRDGRYTLQGLRAGGPYTVTFSFVGYRSVAYENIVLQLGETLMQNAELNQSEQIEAVVVSADGANSSMNINRAGTMTSVSSEQMALMPSVSRSLNDIMKLTPQASSTTSGLAIGGGNYRQSYVTIDGASFNNMFGIGGNLPAGNAPISLDALEQVSVAVTPYDVRQSGFTGGAINAVTKSGTNEVKVSVYDFYKSDALQGTRYKKENGNNGLLTPVEDMSNTLGVSIGAPIVKDKLFIFGNFEYEWTKTPGNARFARTADDQTYGGGTQYNRPTVGQMEQIKDYLATEYNYDPGRYQDYSIKIPNWKLMTRVDWNINRNHSFNARFSMTKNKYSSSPSSSTSPLYRPYLGDYGRTSNEAFYFESSRYYQEQNFTSVAAELNSRFLEGQLTNTLRFTYSHQYEPRSFEGDLFPTVDIMDGDAVLASFGPDPFTYGNLREVGSYIITDEVGYTTGIHHITAGLQFEHDNTKNGFMQGGAGYYVYDSWDDFVNDATPAAFAITHSNRTDLAQVYPSFKYMQYSLYAQDEIDFSQRFKATFGLRLEVPVYPSIAGNENKEFTQLFADNGGYKTSDMPKARLNVSPRVGFNWDMTGERKYILRGGTGIFTGRLPFVWIVSAIGNSNTMQAQTIYNRNDAGLNGIGFHNNLGDILDDLYGGAFTQENQPAPTATTLLDKNLKMPSTWKTSLAVDIKLPRDFDFTLEAIYNKDINAVTVSKLGQEMVDGGVQLPGEPGPRNLWQSQNLKNTAQGTVMPVMIENTDIAGHYFSLTAQLSKRWNFGLKASASYTYAQSKNVTDGISDQVTSAYYTNTFNRNGSNTPELGYSSYVSPHRILVSVGYTSKSGANIGLYYEALPLGYIGNFSYSRYSYTMNTVTGDGGAQNLLYVPTREQLDEMPFADEANREAYWNFINGDKYLSKHKGEYTERGGAVMPWQHILNFKFAQDIHFNVAGRRNTITLGIDINNFANMLNRNWGNYKRYDTTNILNYAAPDETSPKQYKFTEPKLANYAGFVSTWSALLSVRYTF